MCSVLQPVSCGARSRIPGPKLRFATVDDAIRLRKFVRRQFPALSLMGAVMACGQVTEPVPAAIALSLSASSLTLPAGNTGQVVLTVVPPPTGLRLNLRGLPAGVSGSMSPAFLREGETRSTLTLIADSAARPSDVTLTIEALTPGGDNAGGTLQATAKLNVHVTGCPGYAIPSSCPPFPTGGNNAISGVVLERSKTETRPASGASVWAWVQYPNGNGYSAGRVLTDSDGRYRFSILPNALIVLQTGGAGYDQPCASTVELSGPSATANLEVVAQANPIAETGPAQPALVGVVYETTASGRRPLSGARVYFEVLFEIVAATTTTDELGRYSFCRLPTLAGTVTPVKAGYVTAGRSVSVSGLVEMDMEMKRQ